MTVETTADHLVTGEETVIPTPVPDVLGEILFEDSDRVKSYIRAEAIDDDGTPEDLLGLAVLVDVCIANGVFVVSSYERQIFGRGADDVLTERAYTIYPLISNELGNLEDELSERGFNEVEVDDEMSTGDIEEARMTELLPGSDE